MSVTSLLSFDFLQVYEFAQKEATHIALPDAAAEEEKEPPRKKKKKTRLAYLSVRCVLFCI